MAEGVASTSYSLPTRPVTPRPVLTTDQVVSTWLTSPGYKVFWSWILRRCDRLSGKEILTGAYETCCAQPIRDWMDLLQNMTDWISEAPPHAQSNQRFGNLAFREYHKLVNERIPAIVGSWQGLTPELLSQTIPLLVESSAFGQATRLDYGTGHELAFVCALWCCAISGWLGTGDVSANGPGDTDGLEDELILRVFPRYLELVTLLQKTYRLEPAGSHGVWGLDDYCFFPYLLGSAQLLGTSTTPSQSLARATSPNPGPITDLYTLSLSRIALFKSGASFSEHSPLLHQLSSFPNFIKPHAGLRKMFMGEVAGKRVVVQGLWIGGWLWGTNDLPSDQSERSEPRTPRPGGSAANKVAGTQAPWADPRASVLDATRGNWCGTVPPRR